MTNVEIINKLIGPIDPVGETNEDDRRLENLKDMCRFIDALLVQIESVSQEKHRKEFSISMAGKVASVYLKDLKRLI